MLFFLLPISERKGKKSTCMGKAGWIDNPPHFQNPERMIYW
jgi:hypothetical protein